MRNDATCAVLGVAPAATLHVGDHLRLDVAGGGAAAGISGRSGAGGGLDAFIRRASADRDLAN